jgi:hypothetical protein
VACSLWPDVYARCKADPDKPWPEASTFFFMWSAVEDYILTSFINRALETEIQHLSLHFDGFRIQTAEPITDMEAFSTTCSDQAAADTGFVVNLRLKHHQTLFEKFNSIASSVEDIQGLDDVFLVLGNCIPTAVQHLQQNPGYWLKSLQDQGDSQNAEALRRKVS